VVAFGVAARALGDAGVVASALEELPEVDPSRDEEDVAAD